MGTWQRTLGAVMSVCALICVIPAYAAASDTQSSIMIDDNQLIYSTPSHTTSVLEQMRGIGVDTVKVSVVWSLIAPDPGSRTKPNFDASDPAAYPAGAWSRYDLIDKEATKLGMSVYFQLMPPDPVWARAPGPSQGPGLGRDPYETDWDQFVEAVGKRYDGSFVSGYTTSTPSDGLPSSVLGVPLPSTAKPTRTPIVLPQVTTWGIWNEPNERSWLNPYYRTRGRTKQYLQPQLYRNLVDGAWSSLMATGHSGNTILIGETANVGELDPLPFIRDLYCVGSDDLPLHGGAAAAFDCPQSGTPASFVAANPGLFDAAGFAHHPYAFDVPPNRPYPQHFYITLQNVSVLETMLNRIYAAYGRSDTGGVPIYLTEWGYETDPPNPFSHTSLGEQETYLNEGEYMTWEDPYVRALAQFELVDDGPKPHTVTGSRAYWSTFQTGLEYSNGNPKPSYDAWQLPIWVPRQRTGSNVTVWGQLRPADHTTVQYAVLQFARPGSTNFGMLQEVSTTSSEGFFVTHVAIPNQGSIRIAFLSPYTGEVTYSRTVQIQ